MSTTLLGGERDTRTLLPLWRLKGSLTLKTPLSIGSGRDVPIALQEKTGQEGERHVIGVVRDQQGRPYIPAASLKGALNALAGEAGLDAELRQQLFGHEQGNTTRAALIEFRNLYITAGAPQGDSLPNWDRENHPHTANLAHVVRNRDTGAAQDKLLFIEQVVPPGATFGFECTARAIDQNAIEALLGLLALAGNEASPLRLGGGKAADNGRIAWQFDELRGIEDLTGLWQSLSAENAHAGLDLWSDTCSKKLPTTDIKPLALEADHWLTLASLQLDFHTPFLVYQYQPKVPGQNTPDGRPRRNHAGRYALPSSSLHGALRSQAERILRTVGIQARKGYEVPAAHNVGDAAKLDLASVLFGAPGWRSVLRISDFLANQESQNKRFTHEMVAIDRLTGGGKDTAKFNIEVLDCPTLTGSLAIDLKRLRLLEGNGNPGLVAAALGLLAHVLRDLDESDIALGYGAAKGYGRSRSQAWQALAQALQATKPAEAPDLEHALKAFAGRITHAPETAELAPGHSQEPSAPKPGKIQGDFHNPYVFIPFGKPKPETWEPYADLNEGKSHHSHARYAPNTFNGRLVCRLKTVTPIFIGAGDIQGTQDPKQKKNFRLDGQVALPATSLRGVISSLHEAITGSAMRVMDDRHYSVRAVNDQALPKKGRIKLGDHRRPDGKQVKAWMVVDLESKAEYLIPPSVKKRLELLCDERTEDTEKRGEVWPKLKPAGCARNQKPTELGNKLRLVDGQTVYFALDGKKVIELAYSQIWRKIVAASGSADPWWTRNALPTPELSQLTRNRTLLSPSELLFGCVELNQKGAKEPDNRSIQAFSSKTRVGYGISLQPPRLQAETALKILSSPKPPSPALYFQPRQGQSKYISKAMLAKAPADYQLQGRKTYLHALRSNGKVQALDDKGAPAGQRMPWQSARPQEFANQKVRVTPIDAGNEFVFEVDFVNQSQAELESLCACLSPHNTYEHKLGMGKPIGLGSVKISLDGLFLVDRTARYRQTEFADAARYANVWKAGDAQYPAHLALEQTADATPNTPPALHLAQAWMAGLKRTAEEVFNALLLSGNPGSITKPVHYPQMAGLDIETETYRWFVNNDRPASSRVGQQQHLATFTETSDSLPTLPRPRG